MVARRCGHREKQHPGVATSGQMARTREDWEGRGGVRSVGTYLTKPPERKGEIEIVRGAKLKLRLAASGSRDIISPARRFLRWGR